jgi:hypothetical protein
MRAATAIVGAVAISSIAIALAFILSGGSDSGQDSPVRTVTELAEAAKPKPEAEEPLTSESGASPIGGPTPCGSGEFTVEGVSCEVGAEVHDEYMAGDRGELSAKDPKSGETVSMTCEGTAPVTCIDADGGTVYFAH